MSALVLLLALLPAVDLHGSHGDFEWQLSLRIPDEGAGPGRSLVLIDLEISGPADLEVLPPRLEDALAAWRIARLSSSWQREGERERIDLSLSLEQTRPGVVALPGIVVRLRAGSEWQELSWPDLLREARDPLVPDFQPDPPASPWPARARWLALGIVGVLALTLLARVWRKRTPVLVPAHLRALARLAQGDSTPVAHLARLDQVVREYLDERFGLSTRRHTTAELVKDCEHLPELARPALLELSRLTEPARFAGISPSESEHQRAQELARVIVETCATLPVAQGASGEETEEKRDGQ